MIQFKKHIAVPLGFLFVVSIIGVLLRLFYVTPLPLNFGNLLHAHSHVAMLGWMYLGMNLLIYRVFLYKTEKTKTQKWILYFSYFSILGMLIAFPIQGYALFSILFSCLYLLATYWFSYFVHKNIPEKIKHRFSWRLAKTGLLYLILSSLGTWAIGPISATVGVDSLWFNDALYFFLHFLYSGFFFLTILSVLFRIFEKKKIHFSSNLKDKFYVYLNIGIFLSYFLSVLWTKPPLLFYFIGMAGALYQLTGFYVLFKMLYIKRKEIYKTLGKSHLFLIKMSVALLIVRILMQTFSGIPYFAELAFEFKDFIIGYLHLVFLGILTPMLWILLEYHKVIKVSKHAVNLFLIAFISTEILIFYKGFALWLKLPMFTSYYKILAGLSCFFPLAMGWIFIQHLISLKAQRKLSQTN